MGHGHVKPNPNGLKARCGGPAICRECQRELAEMKAKVVEGAQGCLLGCQAGDWEVVNPTLQARRCERCRRVIATADLPGLIT